MKRTILYLIITFLIFRGFSQDLELYFEGALLEPDCEITISGHPDSGMIVLDTLDVNNISSSTMEIKCIRTILQNVDSTVNSFCWGVCYPPFMDTSSVSVTVPSQGISIEFVGDHDPAGQSGVVKVKYAFYDIHTPGNQTAVIVNYDHTKADGIAEKTGSRFISGVYPNPADNLVSIDYDLNGSNHATISVYNFLGNPVVEFDVSDNSGTLTLNTTDFDEGIYFYSLRVNNEIIKTRKLVIRHN